MLIGVRDRARFLLGALVAVAAVAAGALAAFGSKALKAFVLIGQNQERTTHWSVPQKLADGLGAITGGDPGSIVHFTRAVLVAALAVALIYLLRRAWTSGTTRAPGSRGRLGDARGAASRPPGWCPGMRSGCCRSPRSAAPAH